MDGACKPNPLAAYLTTATGITLREVLDADRITSNFQLQAAAHTLSWTLPIQQYTARTHMLQHTNCFIDMIMATKYSANRIHIKTAKAPTKNASVQN